MASLTVLDALRHLFKDGIGYLEDRLVTFDQIGRQLESRVVMRNRSHGFDEVVRPMWNTY